MRNSVAVAAVLALALAGQCFAEDVDSSHDCKEKGGQMDNNGHCIKDGVIIGTGGAAVAAPAVASGAAVGGLSGGVIAGIAAVAVVAVAVGASGGGNNTNHGTTGTTATH